ncbi:8123_t:CDS:1, partial [Ambispora leptoticha]
MDRDKSKNSDSSSDEDLRGMTPIPPNVLISPVILLTKEEMAQQRALKRSAKLERRSSGSFMTIESDSGIVLERDYEKPIVSQLPTVKESPSNSQESDSDSIKNKSGQVSIIEELTSRSQQSEAVKDESGQVSTIEELPSKSQQSEAVKDKSGQVSTIEELSSKSQRSEAAKDKSGQVPTVEKLPLKIQESDSIKTKTEKALVTGSAQSKPRQEGSEPKSRQSKDYNEKVPVASSSTLNAPISPSLSPYSPRISEKISPSTSERKPSPAQQVQKVVMSKKRKLEEIEQMHSGFLSFARKRSDRVRKKLQ